MPKSFDVPVEHDDEPYTVNPYAVTFIRRINVKRAKHAADCTQDQFCPLTTPQNANQPGMKTCTWSDPVEASEICFTNTVGAQSAVQSPLTKRELKNLFDEAIRYNI